MEKAELILIPSPGVGHLVSTIEFAQTLIQFHPHLSISVLLINLPIFPYVDSYIKSLIDSRSNIHFINVPPVDPPNPQLLDKSFESYYCASIESHKPHIKHIIAQITRSRSSVLDSVPVAGLIVDLACVSMCDIGNELGIPTFVFLTSGVGFLNLMSYLPSRHQLRGKEFSFSESDNEVSIPGFLNPVPVRVLPEAVFNKDGGYDVYVQIAERFKEVKGIIVNTFTELESYAIESYKNGKNPKVYPVGPILNMKGNPNPEMDTNEWENIMKWLDDQPEMSVVFLCFGSAGSFDVAQLKEIALGLEQSGNRFLWSIRLSSTENQYPLLQNPEVILPEGFLERAQGRGVLCGWAPQVEVLGHKAIGGFVSHCGWNSILESLWYGVPIATLPIYAEQQLNAFTLVNELGLAVDLKMDYRRNGNVTMGDVEKAVKSVMRCDSEVRKNVKHLSEMARRVKLEGGSSFNAISEFIKDVSI